MPQLNLPQPLLRGWFDVELAAHGSGAATASVPRDGQVATPLTQVEAYGASIEYDAARVDVHVGAIGLCACIGQPRFADAELTRIAETAGPAAACLELQAHAGADFAKDLRGPFALVLVDRARGSALLAVDRFSVRTLCHASDGNRLAFSDRADAIPSRQAAAIDPQAIFEYLYFHVIPAPRTVFSGVQRLRAAHTLECSAAGTRVFAHWRPSFSANSGRHLEQQRDEFRNLIEAAVAHEARFGRVGCFLSGGTDSSTVAGMLARVAATPVDAFSIGFDAAGYDEMEYARTAARHFGVRHHEHYITREELVAAIPAVATWYDQPFGNSSAVPAYCCARLARASGIERLLAGDGGDELFGGNSRYATQRVFEAYGGIPAPLRRVVVEPLLLGGPLPSELPLVRKAASYVRQAKVPLPDRLGTYNLLTRLGQPAVLAPELLRVVNIDAPHSAQRAVWAECADTALINRMLTYDWKYTLADNDLPKVCGTTALAGVQAAFPLLADELVDFSLGLAPEQKLKGLKLRYFFKEALRGFLPESIITKKKHGFGLPFGVWLASHPGLRALAGDALASMRGRGIVRADFVDELWDRRMSEHPGYYGEMVWLLLVLETWLQARAPMFALR
jgi:asparagine synthase (glutamine-hydrolysing)